MFLFNKPTTYTVGYSTRIQNLYKPAQKDIIYRFTGAALLLNMCLFDLSSADTYILELDPDDFTVNVTNALGRYRPLVHEGCCYYVYQQRGQCTLGMRIPLDAKVEERVRYKMHMHDIYRQLRNVEFISELQ